MMFEFRGVLQNAAMGVPAVRNLAARFHSTGMNGDTAAAARMLAFYSAYVDVNGKDVLELGPGQTAEVLVHARRAGARSCVGLDIQDYGLSDAPREPGVEVRLYDGRRLPLSAASVDIVWSSDVLEHVRYPDAVVSEVARVLRPGGIAISRIDLRDHYYLDREPKWFECLKYSEPMWRAISWNRASFVNRLRASDWRRLFVEHGLATRAESTKQSEVLARLHAGRDVSRRVRAMSAEDASTYLIDLVVEKRNAVPA